MQNTLTNNNNVPLSVAVWLANDEYDYIDDPNYISATNLIKSTRQVVLSRRLGNHDKRASDVAGCMASALGNSVHNGIESAWLDSDKRKACLERLGYPEQIIDRVKVNPTPEELLNPTVIPVYMELRQTRQVGKYTIGGKFDFVGQGKLEDFKTTGVYTYLSGSNEEKYRLQGSLYRWLNPEIITDDYMTIQFVFTDWSKRDSMYKDGYPPSRIHPHKIHLMSYAETDLWVTNKVQLLDELESVPEPELPLCDAADLWQDDPVFKYYKNPQKRSRATKNFDTAAEANLRWIEDGQVGVIEEVPGKAKACNYCDAYQICTQKDDLIARGILAPAS